MLYCALLATGLSTFISPNLSLPPRATIDIINHLTIMILSFEIEMDIVQQSDIVSSSLDSGTYSIFIFS